MHATQRTHSRRKTLIMPVGAIALACLFLGLLRWWTAAPQLPPLPNPNGFDELSRATGLIAGQVSWGDVQQADLEEVRSFVEPNREALRIARAGLDMPSRVPVTIGRENLQAHMDQISALRNLGRLLAAAGRIAEEEGEYSAASEFYVDTIRLGHACSQGGSLVDAMVGLAIESMGYSQLSTLSPRLDNAARQELLSVLTEIELSRPSFAEILACEQIWQHETIPWTERLMLGISGMGRRLMQPAIDAGEGAYQRGQARMRLLLWDLAIQNFHHDNQRYPNGLAELVPEYLSTEFADPFGGRPFVYRSERDTYSLYSVGPDGQDDHGRPIPQGADWRSAAGDIVIEHDAK